MRDAELHRFKSDIVLPRFAVERYGYVLDKDKSCRSQPVLRHPKTGDKIVLRLNPDGHWTYFSLRDDLDCGSIVDFVERRGHHTSLGEIRKELRAYLGTPRPDVHVWERTWSPAPPARDRAAVARAFEASRLATTSAYLERRGIRPETLSSGRFAGTWRLAERDHVLFAHRDDTGELTGFEVKGRGFTRFATGGTKAAWQSLALPGDRALVVAESAIDALSHHELRRGDADDVRYASTAGHPSKAQWDLFARLFAALPHGTTVVAAVDSDAAGDALAERLHALVLEHAHLAYRRDSPAPHKDWNDVLQRSLRRA